MKQGDFANAVTDYQKAADLYLQNGDAEGYQKMLDDIAQLRSRSQ